MSARVQPRVRFGLGVAALLGIASGVAPNARAEPASEFVVVAAGAPHYQSANDASFIPSAGSQRAAEFVARKFRETADGWIEIETAPEGAHCAASRGSERVRLHMFVRRAGLMKVLIAPYRARFDDGTWVSLTPGVPDYAYPRGLAMLSFDGVQLELPVPSSALGDSYSLSVERRSARAIPLTETAVLETEYAASGVLGLRVNPRAGTRKGAMIEMRGRCGEYRVRVRDRELSAGRDPFELPSFGRGDARTDDGPRVNAGAPLYWRDGSTAGVVLRPTAWDHAMNVDHRACVPIEVLGEPVILCADEANVASTSAP